MATTTSTAASSQVTLRPAEPGDVSALAQICFEAFGGIHDQHRFPRDFPSVEAAAGMMGMVTGRPGFWGVVAEIDGRVVGSNFLDERDPIRGVGPITVDPEGQNAGVGRKLMEAVIERGKDAVGIRLLQDSFHMRSLSLYASLEFRVTEPIIVMTGKPRSKPAAGIDVRPVEEGDLERCGELCKKVHGFERTGALRDAIGHADPFVAERNGEIVAYASGVTFWPMAHGVGEKDEDMQALLLGAADTVDDPLALLVPLRSSLFRWCLDQGLRAVKPMNLMARGEYNEPRGAWFPSVIY
jgi:predicted N-acetyltransferase YhbS